MKKIIIAILFSLFVCLSVQAQIVNGTVTLKATASDVTATVGDTECGVASVQFFNGSTGLSPVMTTPTSGNDYIFSWDTKAVPNGTYTITAKAIDKAGTGTSPATLCDGSKPNVSTSNALTIVIDNKPPDVSGPSVTITVTITVVP